MKLTEKEAALEAILFTMGKQWKRNDWQKQLVRHPKKRGSCWKNCVQAGKRSAGV